MSRGIFKAFFINFAFVIETKTNTQTILILNQKPYMKSFSFLFLLCLFSTAAFSQKQNEKENNNYNEDVIKTASGSSKEDSDELDEVYFDEIVFETTESDESVYNNEPPPPATKPEKESDKIRCDEVFFMVNKMPEFPGGEQALLNYVYQKGDGPEQKVYVNFIVDCTGHVMSPKVTEECDPKLAQRAIDLVNAMPIWEPGDQNGYKVSVSLTLPVTFRD